MHAHVIMAFDSSKQISALIYVCDCTLEDQPYGQIHFLPVHESHTHALSRDSKHLS